jgi:signal transduction histidine kinase
MEGESADSVIIFLVIGTSAMILMAIAIILFVSYYQKKMLEQKLRQQQMEVTHQREMLRKEMEAQEQERTRISKELHDGVGVMVQSILTNVQSLGNQIATDVVQDISQAVHETHQTVRDAAFDLMPASLQRFGLAAALSDLATRLTKRSPVAITMHTSGTESSLDPQQQLLLFRMAQEAVSNALKHARASWIHVRLDYWSDRLELSITDDGVGMKLNEGEKTGGLGLFNLQTRAELLKARIHFLPHQPSGTKVVIQLPLIHG